MKKCPICAVILDREFYEGFPVHRCPSCTGCLVRESSLEGIKRTREADSAQLVGEVQAFDTSCTHDLVCPACFKPMKKERTLSFPKVEYDACRGCGSIWFDPGELAMLQMTYEASAKGRLQEEMKERLEELENSPDRKHRFEENLSKCRNRSYSAGEAIAGGFFEALISGIFSGRGPTRF